MALLKSSFVTDEIEDTGFDPVPPGMYTAQVVASEIKPTKAGTGEYIKTEFKILDDGPYVGKRVWTNFNIVNPNEQAVKIGQGQLKQLCKACGITELTDTQELHGVPLRIKVAIQEGTDGYDDQNVVKKYISLDNDEEDSNEETSSDPWD